MSSQDEISSLLAGRIEAGDFPSAAYVVAERGWVRLADALGHAVREPSPRVATLDTIYDLASLTKPLVTGLLCALRLESGELILDGEVGFHLPEFDRGGKCTITVGQLLTHTSGLPAWRPLYIEAETSDDVLRVIAAQPLEYAPGTRVLYSDLGFITLGLLIEKLAGAPLAELARRELFEPLGLARTFFNPDAAMQTETAACETGNGFEREMCRGMKMREWANWREHLIWGEVHDGN
ncbi:MAG TPA: serine hydrolase domain-containing protein, partial [Pyrinomonadaceae bacterium]|nr:serine hydrolase domain-containing protein [Pyrinomonadaceae bacterium]